MGNACQQCFQMFQTPKVQKEKDPPLSSQRRMTRKTQIECYNNQQQTAIDEKKQGGCDSSLNSSYQDAKAFNRKESIALGSNFGQKRSSMLSTLSTSAFDSNSVIYMGPGSKINKSNSNKQEYYSVIKDHIMLRKTADSIKVTTPSGITEELNCPPQYLASTLFAAKGIPLQSILQIGNQKSIIQNSNSPIKLTIRICCTGCKKKLKMTFCKSYITLQKLKCQTEKCSNGTWSLLDIQANAAIWGDGRRIDNHQQLQQVPSQIRVMGCIICMRFSNLSKQLKCGCMVCKNCLLVNQIDDIQCPICEANDEYIQ